MREKSSTSLTSDSTALPTDRSTNVKKKPQVRPLCNNSPSHLAVFLETLGTFSHLLGHSRLSTATRSSIYVDHLHTSHGTHELICIVSSVHDSHTYTVTTCIIDSD